MPEDKKSFLIFLEGHLANLQEKREALLREANLQLAAISGAIQEIEQMIKDLKEDGGCSPGTSNE